MGGIEAEAVMLGQTISMVLPKVVGYKLTGEIDSLATSTDVVLTITKVRHFLVLILLASVQLRIYDNLVWLVNLWSFLDLVLVIYLLLIG